MFEALLHHNSFVRAQIGQITQLRTTNTQKIQKYPIFLQK